MRVGIIGTGKHGSRYASHVVGDVAGLELAAICRRSSAGVEQAKEWHCALHEDFRSLIADPAVEAVISVVPPALNLAIARACARAGKSLLLEKPLAASLADGRAIVRLVQTDGLRLTVGQTLRYNRVIGCFRRHLGEIGPLYTVLVNQRIEPSTLAWHEDPAQAGAGVSFHTAVHIFDALYYITGLEIRRVMAMTANRHNRVLEDSLQALIEMDQGVRGVIDCSKIGQARSGRFEFVGREGQLAGDQIHNTCQRIRHTERKAIDPGSPVATIIPLLEGWRDYLLGAGPNPVPGADGLRALAVCDACLRSAEQERWMAVQA